MDEGAPAEVREVDAVALRDASPGLLPGAGPAEDHVGIGVATAGVLMPGIYGSLKYGGCPLLWRSFAGDRGHLTVGGVLGFGFSSDEEPPGTAFGGAFASGSWSFVQQDRFAAAVIGAVAPGGAWGGLPGPEHRTLGPFRLHGSVGAVAGFAARFGTEERAFHLTLPVVYATHFTLDSVPGLSLVGVEALYRRVGPRGAFIVGKSGAGVLFGVDRVVREGLVLEAQATLGLASMGTVAVVWTP